MSKDGNTILITGGAGFMASNFIRYLLGKRKNVKIVNLDKLTYAGNLDNVKDLVRNKRYVFVKGDIGNQKLVNQLFKKYKFSQVINFAAESHVDRSILGPRAFVQTDVLGVLTLLEATRVHGIKKFVQISTDEVYGEARKGLFRETTPFSPRSPYSASKAGGDMLVMAYYHTYKLPIVRTHSCNFYGEYQYPEKFIPLFITNLIEGKKVPLYGNGEQIREWIYVEDFCRALDIILKKGKIGEVYNIGSGRRKRNIDVACLLIKMLGASNKKIVQVADRPGHDVRYAIDAKKLRSLGFAPEYSFKKGLEKTVKWYIENEWWWRRVKQSRGFKEYYQKQYGEMLS